ncbi:hypothetical protein AAFC00_005269 [Neodothiora populina]|uniref:histone deacetylase n=1 Tax=Neodothiora populina TaxID=2781224 RepID=A0ABR3PKB9_9PEZI
MDPGQIMRDTNHVMGDGLDILVSTEMPMNGSIDPSAIFNDPMEQDVSLSPELDRPAIRGSISKIPNGSRDSHSRSPSYKQETKSTWARVQKSEILPYSTSVTGLVYDVRMRFHVEVEPKKEHGVHPEDPRRIYSIYQELVEAGLVDDPDSPGPVSDLVLGRIPARFATKEEICAVHTEQHFEWVCSLKDWDNNSLYDEGEKMDSIYLSRNSPMCARLSAGGAIEACRAIWNEQIKNVIAVIRPPGHHAEHDTPKGFCFFNNVPIAARACQKEFPDKCRKVMILDWDVHHGNGVQEAFYDDPNVLYISLHVHKDGYFYPAGDYGDHLHCGEGKGLGRNVNIPWKTAGMTDGDYLYAFQQIVMPIAQDFDPDMVIVSAGFDAAEGDMLGLCHVSPAGYAHMTHMLMSLADGKVAVCLEGGYNLRSIAVSALAVTRTLMGEPPERLISNEPSPTGVDTVELVKRTQSKFWPCLYPRNPSDRFKTLKAARMHDIIREWQTKKLFEDFDMTSLFIARNKISKSFEGQVLATPNYTEDRPLLLIFHDPPEMSGEADPRTSKMELHNSYVVDGLRDYIAWAVKEEFSVIDVNIPKHNTSAGDDFEMKDEDAHATRVQEAFELANYIWENYVEVYDRPQIFIMGVGAAYASIVQMLKSHDRFRDQIGEDGKIYSFISDNDALHAYKSLTEDYLAERWYRNSTLIFVADKHNIWVRAKTKSPSKRWGTLIKSDENHLEDMLALHKDQVLTEMMELSEEWRSSAAAASGESSSSAEDELAMQTDHRALGAATMAVPTPRSVPALPNPAVTSAPYGIDSNGNNNDIRASTPPMPRSPGRLPPLGNFALTSPIRTKPASPAKQ